MYKSPIEITQGQMRMEQENNILRVVYAQDIHADKHELLRALQYDRGQYEKGYQDAQPKWIPVTERLPEKDLEDVLVYDGFSGCFISFTRTTIHGEKYFVIGDKDVTHWMPLPDPPKEEE